MFIESGLPASYQPITDHYNAEIDDFTSILRDICEIMQTYNQFHFEMKIDDVTLPVDIRIDLRVFLESLNEFLSFLDSSSMDEQYIIDMYEQGIESQICLEKNGNSVGIEMSGKFSVGKYFVDRCDIDRVATRLLMRFVLFSGLVCPNKIRAKLLTSWLDSTPIRTRLFD